MISSTEMSNSGLRGLIADVLGYLPFVSDMCRWSNMWGCTPATMCKFMKNGENVAIIPGGFQVG